jgi:hypothetical protein
LVVFNLTNYFSIQLLPSESLLIHSVSVIQFLHKGATTTVSTAMDGLIFMRTFPEVNHAVDPLNKAGSTITPTVECGRGPIGHE